MVKSHENVENDGQILGWVSCSPGGGPDPLLKMVLLSAHAREMAIEADRERIRANPELLDGVQTGTFNISDRH